MDIINLDAFRSTPVSREPFEHCLVPEFVQPDSFDDVERDFPVITRGGSFPLGVLDYGPAFEKLTNELLSDEVGQAFGEYFGIDLSNRPTTLTVRGRSRASRDGRIHLDSKTKLITVLIFMNRHWEDPGGRLRLLRSADDINDVVVEIPPEDGLMAAFRCRKNAWHGHLPYEGERRTLQLNWVVDEAAARRSERRHGLSSFFKRLTSFRKAS